LTLFNADINNDRIDAIVVDINDDIVYLQGVVNEKQKPLISLLGKSNFHSIGFTLTGNSINTDTPPKYIIESTYFDDISCVGNFWKDAHTEQEVIKCVSCNNVEIIGNHGDNKILTI